MPGTYSRLVRVLEDERAGLPELAVVVESDVALAAKILQLANSALFGVRQPVSSLSQAISLLGIELLRTIALSEGAFGRSEVPAAIRRSVAALHEHSLLVARTAAELTADTVMRRDVFAAGMLHDVGRLIMALEPGPPDSSSLVIRRPAPRAAPAHALVGAYLLGLWGVPGLIIEAVAQHHTPPTPDTSVLAALVFQAEELVENQSRLSKRFPEARR